MGYKSFENISDVCLQFDCSVKMESFLQSKEFVLDSYMEKKLIKNFSKLSTFANENVICEKIIAPILEELEGDGELQIWSHFALNVDESLNLNGIPDYILAPPDKSGLRYTTPLMCLVEAKKDDFEGGWGQVAAEMIAAQKLNGNEDIPIYGLVSTGRVWQFGFLKNKIITIDTNSQTAPQNLNKLVSILNWVFCEARKNADKLAEFAKNNNKKR